MSRKRGTQSIIVTAPSAIITYVWSYNRLSISMTDTCGMEALVYRNGEARRMIKQTGFNRERNIANRTERRRKRQAERERRNKLKGCEIIG